MSWSELDGRDLKNMVALNARRSRTDSRRDLRFAAYSCIDVYSYRAKFGKPTLDSFRVIMRYHISIESSIMIFRSLPAYTRPGHQNNDIGFILVS